jgi:hypothetical protein
MGRGRVGTPVAPDERTAMTSHNDPTPDPAGTDGTDESSDYARTGQHGPEMDDTQVQATEEFRDELPAAAPEGTTDED